VIDRKYKISRKIINAKYKIPFEVALKSFKEDGKVKGDNLEKLQKYLQVHTDKNNFVKFSVDH